MAKVVTIAGNRQKLITIPQFPDHDQQSAPLNPAIGHTWIERNGDATVRAVWEWNGVLWLTIDSYPLELHSNSGTTNGNGNGSAKVPGFPFDCDLFVENLMLSFLPSNSLSPGGTNDSNLQYYTFAVQKMIRNTGTTIGTTISQQGGTYTSGWNAYKFQQINTLVSFAGANQDGTNTIARGLRAAWTRSAGTIQFSNFCMAIAYRLARR
jgi:hypothetical protein